MKISIITATYNSEKALPSAIEAIKNQTYPNIEWIVVDGLSKDGTIELIESNSDIISNWVSEKDKGIYDALNKGVKMATGDVIGFLHSDDFFADAKAIENIVAKFIASSADGVYGDLEYVQSQDVTKIVRYWKSKSFERKNLKKGWMPPHPTLFLKKEVYAKHGLFDLSYSISGDYDFMLRILNDDKLEFAYLPEVITKMRVGGASSNLGNVKQKMKEDVCAIRKNQIGYAPLVLFRKNFSKITQFIKRN